MSCVRPAFHNVYRRHISDSVHATRYGPGFVKSLAKNHKYNAVFTVASTDTSNEMTGCALLLIAEGAAAGPLIGVTNNDLNRKAFTYFNLSLCAPVRFCIENNISRIYFGGGLRTMKRRRGCNDMDTYVFIRPQGPLTEVSWRAWSYVHCRWILRKSRIDPK